MKVKSFMWKVITKHTNSDLLGWVVLANVFGVYILFIFGLVELFNKKVNEILLNVFLLIALIISISAWIFIFVDNLFYSFL